MKAYATAALVLLLSACGPGPGTGPEPGGFGASATTDDNTDACGPVANMARLSSELHGSLEAGDIDFWRPDGACTAWGDGVASDSSHSVDGFASVTMDKPGCLLTSPLVELPPEQTPWLKRHFILRMSSLRSDDTCVAGSATAVHCAEMTINWYDPNRRLMYSETFQVGGPTPREWHAASVDGYASDYARFFSVSVGGSMAGIPMGPIYIDAVSMTFAN